MLFYQLHKQKKGNLLSKNLVYINLCFITIAYLIISTIGCIFPLVTWCSALLECYLPPKDI